MTYRNLRSLGQRRDAEFYVTALRYAQTLWSRGMPAQAILQLNRAWSAELDPEDLVLSEWPPPYRALTWMLERRPAGCFIGNPVRHFQHLATRVRGRDAEIRSWRAWACFRLAEKILPEADFPRDQLQADREELVFPDSDRVLSGLKRLGWEGEAGLLGELIHGQNNP
ncbi:hypothetical protein HAHE_03510 [Haloferula helveola]|uniref:Uncharacterized protein n=2 Tax=Haloferula helveola TaxID=490095 RepID=A0ABM7RAB5_9BACT|nr:hypothetical protein HAHE_03510 [Haloferula helveola]